MVHVLKMPFCYFQLAKVGLLKLFQYLLLGIKNPIFAIFCTKVANCAIENTKK